jgi:hypothetical protein
MHLTHFDVSVVHFVQETHHENNSSWLELMCYCVGRLPSNEFCKTCFCSIWAKALGKKEARQSEGLSAAVAASHWEREREREREKQNSSGSTGTPHQPATVYLLKFTWRDGQNSKFRATTANRAAGGAERSPYDRFSDLLLTSLSPIIWLITIWMSHRGDYEVTITACWNECDTG